MRDGRKSVRESTELGGNLRWEKICKEIDGAMMINKRFEKICQEIKGRMRKLEMGENL
jgi:hypothetical protein